MRGEGHGPERGNHHLIYGAKGDEEMNERLKIAIQN